MKTREELAAEYIKAKFPPGYDEYKKQVIDLLARRDAEVIEVIIQELHYRCDNNLPVRCVRWVKEQLK